MSRYSKIYLRHAARYDELVSHEDFEGNLIPCLHSVADLDGARVAEFGAGTGRLTRLLLPFASRVAAFDASPHMIARARRNLAPLRRRNYTLGVAGHFDLPVAPRSQDLAIEGWSFGHPVVDHPRREKTTTDRLVGSMRRLLVPGGTAVVIETLGTGRKTPRPPSEALARFYGRLETVHGFRRKWVRTDYRFDSVRDAARIMGFFFGREMEMKVRGKGSPVVPECTGIWFRRETRRCRIPV